MLGLKTLPTLLVAALSALSSVAAGPIENRQSCQYTCGSVCYWAEDIQEAVAQGYGYYQDNQQVGSNDYPHSYNNYEGLPLLVSGPYQEFPILKTYKPYTGGSPGPDRVVFNTKGQFAAVVTHTGASGNDFVSCK
ncbi:Ribonuclease/ribotoxin [Microdochium trichocladiopsis]|uniref:ribonuclease T1 n=1 Tax=Microdochium trichocladiopsis TaxID=1682393 RepID=A0A9P8YF12_9PEZI|nr:Ribonuclease/ribotoxin [Microdochium trichocladiopsis]KAH7038029.1 Ribonuclease/ribotoxin [Microdochium trichocladiopsis]